MKIKDKKGLFIKISDEEVKMIKSLRRRGSINISQLVRNSIKSQYDKLK